MHEKNNAVFSMQAGIERIDFKCTVVLAVHSPTYDFVTQLIIIRAEETPKPKVEISKLR